MDLSVDYFFDTATFAHKKLFNDSIYVWQALEQIKTYLKEYTSYHIDVEVPVGVFLVNREQISIGKGTILEPGAYIKGPCIIGENCEVRQGAYIRGDVITGNKCVIGHDTEIKHTILLDGAKAAHFAYLGDSILGNSVNLGAGTKCANLRLDHLKISFFFEGKKIETGLKKFGAIIGDGSQLGCNSVTNPGTILGKEVMGYPCINFGGLIPSKSRIRPAQQVKITQCK